MKTYDRDYEKSRGHVTTTFFHDKGFYDFLREEIPSPIERFY